MCMKWKVIDTHSDESLEDIIRYVHGMESNDTHSDESLEI